MSTFTVDHTPADIVKAFPQASDLFNENMINFCCKGGKPLKDTLTEENMDGEAILAELNAAYQQWKDEGSAHIDWEEVPTDELVTHISTHHHEKLLKELPAVSGYVEKVYQVHGGADQPHLEQIFHLYNQLKTETIEHTIPEEKTIFSLIKDYVDQSSEKVLQDIRELTVKLKDRHDTMNDLVQQIRTKTNGFEPPANACGTYRVMYDRLSEIESDMIEYIHLENNILFERL